MQIQQTERVFRYSGGLVLPDPDPSLGLEAVRQVYASSYPEIHVQNGSGHKKLKVFMSATSSVASFVGWGARRVTKPRRTIAHTLSQQGFRGAR